MGSVDVHAKSASPPVGDADHDQRYEHALVSLMCQMEQTLSSLPEGGNVKHLVGTMQMSRQLVEKVIAFADEHCGALAQDRVLDDLRRVSNESRPLEESLGRLSKIMVKAFYDARGDGFRGANSAYSRLGSSLTVGLASCFSHFAGRFRGPDKPRQWRSTFQIFLEELHRRW